MISDIDRFSQANLIKYLRNGNTFINNFPDKILIAGIKKSITDYQLNNSFVI
jgi:hypothetical protein